MKKILTGYALIAALSLAACCSHHGTAKGPVTPNLTIPQQLARETVALDHWVVYKGQDEDDDPILEDAQPTDKGAFLSAYCAGVWVSPNQVLTAYHCVENMGRPELTPIQTFVYQLTHVMPPWDPTGQPLLLSSFGDVEWRPTIKVESTRDAEVAAIDTETDLALIKVKPGPGQELPQHLTARLAADLPRFGDEVHIVGHPMGNFWTYSHGYVAARRQHSHGPNNITVDAMQVSAPVWFGDSGGGAFNSSGELVGTFSWITTKIPDTGYFIDTDTVRTFLKQQHVL